jgi:hypothetical protein
MQLRDVPAPEWRGFLEQFGRDHRGWLATVERRYPGISSAIEIRERPLVAIETRGEDGSIVDIQVHFHPDMRPDDRITIALPKTIRVELNDDGAAEGVEIESARGERVHIAFRGALPEGLLLDGVAPGEV